MVTIEVGLWPATETKSKVSFNLLCPEHKSRIKNKRWCPTGEHELEWSAAVRGYEYEKGSYVALNDEDLGHLQLKSSQTIEIAGFIDEGEVDGALYYLGSYYLEPTGAGPKPYALLRDTLARTKRVAIAKFSLHERERLVIIRPLGDALLLNTLHWPEEIRSSEGLSLPSDVKTSPAELKQAEMLVELMLKPFDPSEFRDQYKEAVDRIVRAKVEERVDLVEAPEPVGETAPANIVDMLKASIERAEKEQRAEGRTDAPTQARSRRKAS